jgi:MerR family transcriptional regulator, thiopeptide resistance regulator
MLKIGDISKKTGVSVRSLRHYDEMGLLKPSSHSASGYRLYTADDIYRLQQIMSLKQMRIPLKKIQTMLLDDGMSLQETLELHQDFLRKNLEEQKSLCRKIDQLVQRLSDQQTVSLESIYNTMENITMLEKYYTEAQLNILDTRAFNNDKIEGELYAQEWTAVFTGLEKLQSDGVSANDKKTQVLAQKAKALVQIFTDGDKGIEQNLKKMHQQEGGVAMLRAHGIDISDSVYAYYQAAREAHD